MRKLALIATFCLACVADAAWAFGLGSIEVYSTLNQPLRAEIPLFAVKPGERDSITVQLAPAAAFERTGIEQIPIHSDLRFRVVQGAGPDQAILQVTTVQSVREPFLALLLEVTWPEGRLVREFTVLLDPPAVATGRTAPRRPASSFEQASPGASFGDSDERPRFASAGGSTYGPVRAQETLWSIAYAQRPDASISMDQMMQAIYEANPEAFDGSISRIRSGSMLRIPSASEIRATDPTQARREVRRERRANGASPAPVEMDDVARAPAAPTPAPPPAPAAEPQGELRLSPPADSAAATSEPAPAAAQPAQEAESAAAAPPATTAVAPKSTAPIEIRDNSAKALELLAAHAREHSARQLASDQLTAETTQATTPAPAPPVPAAQPAPATPAPAPTTEPAPTTTQPAPAPPPADSPFVDEPAPAGSPPPATSAEQPPSVEEPPPAPAAGTGAGEKPPAAQVDVVDTSLPEAADTAGGINPLLLGLAAAALLLVVLGVARLRKYRAAKSTVQIAPVVLSQAGDMQEPAFGDTLETPAHAGPRMADTLRTATEPPVARTLETTLQRSLPPEQTTKQFMAVSTPTPSLPPDMPAMVDQAAPAASDPYADALGEVDIHIAYGLYDEAARLLQEPLAKSPDRKDLHLKLLEVYFSANMASEFEAQSRKMQAVLTSPTDPDWEKVCIMGRQLCPESTLFGGGGGLGTTADLDISSMMAGAQPSAEAKRPASGGTAAPSLDLDLSGFNLGMEAPSTAAPKPSAPAPAPAAKPGPSAADTGNTLDFNLDDFKFDTPATAPADSAKPSPSDADNALDIDLTDFDIGTPASSDTAAPAGKTADTDTIDDLLSSEPEGGEGQADTRLDLARAYMDMGEPAMAQSLLQEVIAQGNAAQKQEAQELLGRLGSS